MTDQKKEEPRERENPMYDFVEQEVSDIFREIQQSDFTNLEAHQADTLMLYIQDLRKRLSRSEAEKNRMISKANDFVDNCEAEGLAQPGVILAMRGLIDYLTND